MTSITMPGRHSAPAVSCTKVHSGPALPLDPGVELRHLRYFLAVAEQLHFGRAAEALHISQPPLSRQIRDLEEYVGTPLLERTSRGVVLTDAGRVFARESARVLGKVSQAMQKALCAAQGEAGRLTVGFTPTLQQVLLPELRRILERKMPQLTTTFEMLTSEEQIPRLRNGSLDAGIILSPVREADQLELEPLFSEPAVVVMSAMHPLVTLEQLSLRDVRRSPILQVRDGFTPKPYDHITRISVLCGVPLPVRRTVTIEQLVPALQEGRAVTIMPASFASLCKPGVRCLPVTDRHADFTYALASRRKGSSRSIGRFLEITRRATEKLMREREQAAHGETAAAAYLAAGA